MSNVNASVKNGVVEGYCAPKFERVMEAFVENLNARGEIGASVCITFEGETVVDLWGGLARRPKEGNPGTPWEKDTVCVVFSSTKGATALCAHMLASRGILDLDAPVADYWPEYAVNGKEDTRVSMMLDHTAGSPAHRTPVKQGGTADFDYMADLLAQEEPFWSPGSRQGYHGLTYAWTIGSVIRRAAGKSLQQFFADEVAGPLGLDFRIGVPEGDYPETEKRLAPIVPASLDPERPKSKFQETIEKDNQSIPALFLLNTGGMTFNDPALHKAEVGSANGMTNGRGLAHMYAPLALGGGQNGVTLVDAPTLSRMGRVSAATQDDATLRMPTRFALGFMKSMDNRKLDKTYSMESAILGDAAFGHVGAGGSIGFADPAAGMSFGYTMNKQGLGLLLNDRGQALVDAAYQSIGYRTNEAGVWER